MSDYEPTARVDLSKGGNDPYKVARKKVDWMSLFQGAMAATILLSAAVNVVPMLTGKKIDDGYTGGNRSSYSYQDVVRSSSSAPLPPEADMRRLAEYIKGTSYVVTGNSRAGMVVKVGQNTAVCEREGPTPTMCYWVLEDMR